MVIHLFTVLPATLFLLSLQRVPFFVEYCTGGPSSTTPVLLELCVDPFNTAPPPPDLFAGLLCPAPPFQDLFAGLLCPTPPSQDLFAGLLYTAPPPSTGDSSSGSYLPSP
ncbi:uncharacterized protein UDID_19471 [Ustilago sp. UG-2017a]|nr:uncharacterized protein UDID_19471 [Ustilago sp. UG-2017a]